MNKRLCIACLLVSTVANATPYESGGKVDQYFGSYSEHVDIVVPPFHGLEPHLAIDYNSARGNGMLGVGWALSGLSVIERVDAYTANDPIYELDGQRLIRCEDQTDRDATTQIPRSPSCSPDAAGSAAVRFSTLQETYLRIETSGTGFTVIEPNGTRRFYKQMTTAPKWVLVSATDLDGNTVSYDWFGPADGVAFDAPKAIRYNGTVIAFSYTVRNPTETYANHGALETMDRTLSLIDVCVDGNTASTTPCATNGTVDPRRARAYSLAYRNSMATMRPLLTGVTMFGKNAAIKGTQILSGDHFPAMSFQWNDPSPSFTQSQIGAISNWGSEWLRGMVDFNGDGKTDFCRDDGSNLTCAMSFGSGFNDFVMGTINDWGEDKSGAWVDWDGDGKADFCRLVCRDDKGLGCGPWDALAGYAQHHFLTCALSTGSGINDVELGEIPEAQIGSQGARWFVDWNGDGKTDFCRAFDDTTRQDDYRLQMKCAYSMGAAGYDDKVVSAFHMATYQTTLSDVLGVAETRAMTDINGDGRADFCRVVQTQTANEVRCMTGFADEFDPTHHLDGQTTDSFDTTLGTVADIGDLDSQWWVDVNGDGKADYCRMTGNSISCAISLQTSLVDGTWSGMVTVLGVDLRGAAKSRRWADINGDGKADFCRDVNGEKVCDVSLGARSTMFVDTHVSVGSNYEKHWLVDWDGDGYPEYCMNTGSSGGSGSFLSCVRGNPYQVRDVATSFGNGIGGTSTAAYEMSTFVGQSRPSFPVVTSVTRTGGAEGAVKQIFSYTQPHYDAWSRRFLGFGWTAAIDPCLPGESPCPFTATVNRIDPRWPTAPSSVTLYTGGQQPLEMTTYLYVDSTATPYRSELWDASTFRYTGSDYIQTERQWGYDPYGNVGLAMDYGAVADTTGQTQLTGDETSVDVTFEPDVANYVLDRPTRITSSAAVTLTDVNYIYNAQGHPTQTQTWVDNPNHVITTTATYDAQGNLATETDGIGNTVVYTIDPTYHEYVAATTYAAVNQSESAAWDFQCAARTKVTQDQNGTSKSATYDNLCRKIRDDLPGGGWEKVAYNDTLMGTSGQYTEVSGPGAVNLSRGSSDLWARTYFDGWGRTTKSMQRGANAGVDIVSAEYTFNARGKLATQTRPHYTSDVGFTYSYGYDTADRTTSARLPSATTGPGDSATYIYGQLQTTTVDAVGSNRVEHFDAHGRRAWTCTQLQGQCDGDLTLYGYDGRGRVATIQQQINNGTQWALWVITTDSLGRKTYELTPDAAAHRYYYDDASNLIDSYDGNGSQVHFTYDALHRRTSKSWGYCVPTAGHHCWIGPSNTVTWTYDEQRSGYDNVGKLTSMTDASGTATYNYDAAGNLVQGGRTAFGTAYNFSKQYDLGGRLLATTYPDGSTVGTASDPLVYDTAGRLTYIPGFVIGANYDAAGTLTQYTAANWSSSTFRTDNPRGQIAAYRTTRQATAGPLAVLGDYSGSETFPLSPSLAAGQTITVSTCGSSVPGAAGTGDTVLHLRNAQGVDVASNDNAGGACGALSTLRYTVPSGGDGAYTVFASCATSAICTGTVAARVESPQTNVALGKAVTMSSVFDPTCGPPAAATDGITAAAWCSRFSIAHTKYESQPWLQIDLGSTQQIEHINIWNRSDSLCDAPCLQRLSNFDVKIWTGSAWVGMANVPGEAGWPTRVDLNTTARYVLIQLRGTNYLNTPEIEVFTPPAVPPVLYSSPLVHDVTVYRDGGGRISSIASNRARESWTFGYDEKSELRGTINSSDPNLSRNYTYDAGNQTTSQLGALSYGGTAGPHALTAMPNYTFSYDNNGAMTAATNIYAPYSYTYTWNGAGQLVSANGIAYTYAADGDRLAKTYNGSTTVYLGDDYEVTNGVATKYVSLGGRLVGKQQGGAAPTFLYTDVRGSVVYGLDVQGAAVFTTSYGPFGEVLAGGVPNARGFTGQRMDEAGLLYLHARYALPGLGRFLSPDPTVPTDRPIGMNPYAFAQNDPVNRTDIDGLGFWEDAGAWMTNAADDVAKVARKANVRDVVDGIHDFFGLPHIDPLLDKYLGKNWNLGIGNSLALLPEAVAFAGRGDWQSFGQDMAYQWWISTEIAIAFMTDGTAYEAGAGMAMDELTPFVLTMIKTGNVNAALHASLGDLPKNIVEHGKDASLKTEWWEEAMDTAGKVAGPLKDADDYAVFAPNAHATGAAPMSMMSTSWGTLFGYGYTRSQRMPLPPPAQ